MTLSTTGLRITYSGNGVTDTFSFPYRFLENEDLVVSVDGVTQVLNTDYTVSGAGGDSGGTVTMTTAPVSDALIIITRELELTQEIDYITGDPFPAQTHERGLDRLTMIAQQINRIFDRAFKISDFDTVGFDTEIPEIKATEGIRFNDAGDGLTTFPITFAQQLDLLAEITARIAGDDSLQSQIVNLINGYTAADANIQAQLTGNVPLEASAFSPISWHDQIVETSVTIPDNKNAWSFGPSITIADGVSVTVGEGSSWTIADGEVTV